MNLKMNIWIIVILMKEKKCGANELEEFYQLRFKYKKKWNNGRENKVD